MKTIDHLSYLMGADDITDQELESINVEIVGKTDTGSRKLLIPEQSLKLYIQLITNKLNKGFWNEVVGAENILFVFRFEDGHVEQFTLSPENEQQIDALCAEFNNESPDKTANVYMYISENDFYHDFMMRHYRELIER